MGRKRFDPRPTAWAFAGLLAGAALATLAAAQPPAARRDTARDTAADTTVVVGSRTLQGEDYTIPRHWRVAGDVHLRDGNLTVLGEVTGDVEVENGDADIAGRVGGDVSVRRGDVTLRPTAVVDGNVQVVGGTVTDEGGRVHGEIRALSRRFTPATETETSRVEVHIPGVEWIAWGIGLLQTIVGYLVVAALAWLWLRLAPASFDRAEAALRQRPWRALGMGLAILVLWLPMFLLGIVVLAVSIVGLVALPFYLLLAPLALLTGAGAGLVLSATWIGQRLLPGRGRLPGALAGLGLLFGPILAAQILGRGEGFLDLFALLLVVATAAAQVVAMAWGLGAVVVAILQARPWQRRPSATTEAAP